MKNNSRTITGIFTPTKSGNGFVDIVGEKKGYFVHQKYINSALPGDTVQAKLVFFGGKNEARIQKILKTTSQVFVGIFHEKGGKGKVVCEDIGYIGDVFITPKEYKKHIPSLQDKSVVAFEVSRGKKHQFFGNILHVLGKSGDKNIEVDTLLLEGGASLEFPQSVLHQTIPTPRDTLKRHNLQEMFFCTIDSESAKDLDDAIAIKNVGEGYILYVSIADVSEYVREGSLIDTEALKRGNSLYVVDRVLPMLPPTLSNDLCSLLPHTKKLTLTCEIHIDKNGNITRKKVYESTISTKYRLTYKETQEILDKKILLGDTLYFGGICSKELVSYIQNLDTLKNICIKKKQKAGYINFDFPEMHVELDSEGEPISIEKTLQYETMKIVEECMILANLCVGELYQKYPFIYRIHPEPSDDDIEDLREVLQNYNIDIELGKITPKWYARLLQSIETHPSFMVLQRSILKSMQKAVYSPKNEGHFGLNVINYSHFTSPIRRYSDLLIHRIIKHILHRDFDNKKKAHFYALLPTITQHISQTERNAEKLEYTILDYYIGKYYEKRIGEIHTGMISGMIDTGCFVELQNGVEGFVSFLQMTETLGVRTFLVDESKVQVYFSKKYIFTLGDKVEIQIQGTQGRKKRLNFDFIQKIIQ